MIDGKVEEDDELGIVEAGLHDAVVLQRGEFGKANLIFSPYTVYLLGSALVLQVELVAQLEEGHRGGAVAGPAGIDRLSSHTLTSPVKQIC